LKCCYKLLLAEPRGSQDGAGAMALGQSATESTSLSRQVSADANTAATPSAPASPPPKLDGAESAATTSSPRARSSRPMAVQWRVAKGWSQSFGGSSSSACRAVPVEQQAATSGSISTAQRRTERLEAELQSLREAYSRKISATELRCERQLSEKDDECRQWYNDQKHEIRKMKACVVVMQALFGKKKRSLHEQLSTDRAEFLRKQGQLQEEMVRMEDRCRHELYSAKKEFQQKQDNSEIQIIELTGRVESLTVQKAEMQDDLVQERQGINSLREDIEKKAQTIQELHRNLADAKQHDQLAAKVKQIEDLESELKRTRRNMQKQNQMENESLRQEVNDYIKFIVHKLPTDWEERREPGGSNGYDVPGFIRDKLATSPKRPAPFPGESVSTMVNHYDGRQLSARGGAHSTLPPLP